MRNALHNYHLIATYAAQARRIKLFLFDGKKRCTLTLAIPHQDIAHNGKSAYLHGGSALYRRNILQQDFLAPVENRPEKQQQFIVGSNGIGSMNQLLDTDNQQKHEKGQR